jgi:hypothetical protein
MRLAIFLLKLLSILVGPTIIAEASDTSRGDDMLAAYFRDETQHLADASLANIKSADDWNQHRDE